MSPARVFASVIFCFPVQLKVFKQRTHFPMGSINLTFTFFHTTFETCQTLLHGLPVISLSISTNLVIIAGFSIDLSYCLRFIIQTSSVHYYREAVLCNSMVIVRVCLSVWMSFCSLILVRTVRELCPSSLTEYAK